LDVAPILRDRCAGCHRENGFGPMPLTTYDEAKPRAASIRDEVLSGRMPPWFASPGFGSFSNDASLTPIEMELLARWADGGAPIGPQAVRIPDRRGRDENAPTVRLELPSVDVDGDSIGRFAMDPGVQADRWITGWEFHPGAARLVDEATVTIGSETLGTWTPFDARIDFPSGVGQRLRRASRVGISVRYRKTTEPQRDRSSLVLRLQPRPRRELRHRLFGCGIESIDRDIDVLAVRPHAAAADDTIEVVAHRPDDSLEPLCVVSRYQPTYAVTYRLRTPVRLTRGTRIDVRSSSTRCEAMIDFVRR
jgi:hypothetical protein